MIDALRESGHPTIAAANPLRGVAADAAAIGDLVRTIDDPVVLVGHSYGGSVISNVDPSVGEIAALVYVAAFAPEAGESCLTLSGMFPGSTLGEALRPVPRADGTTDLYIRPELFGEQFAADVPPAAAARMAAAQRPVTQEALVEPSGDRPLWRQLPCWFAWGDEDRNIPAALQRHMAARAGAIRTLAIGGASHAIGVSRPRAVAELVLEAARAGATSRPVAAR